MGKGGREGGGEGKERREGVEGRRELMGEGGAGRL